MNIVTMLVGSHAHGLAVRTSDKDYMSIFTAPLAATLGLEPYKDVYVERTAPEGQRGTSDDTDHVYYELRHFMKLATDGNPNMLIPFFIDRKNIVASTNKYWTMRGLADSVVSKKALKRHHGYLIGQRDRMLGLGRQSAVPNRPELVERYGFDTKYAAHAMRLGFQGVELAMTGRLTLPMRDQERMFLLEVRNGIYTKDYCLDDIDILADKLDEHIKTTDLPDDPDYDRINEFLIDMQL